MLSIDGIQPDKGNETVSLLGDGLTGRVLAAENVRTSDTCTIRSLLQPISDLKLPVLLPSAMPKSPSSRRSPHSASHSASGLPIPLPP
jgi:hypothetical protein